MRPYLEALESRVQLNSTNNPAGHLIAQDAVFASADFREQSDDMRIDYGAFALEQTGAVAASTHERIEATVSSVAGTDEHVFEGADSAHGHKDLSAHQAVEADHKAQELEEHSKKLMEHAAHAARHAEHRTGDHGTGHSGHDGADHESHVHSANHPAAHDEHASGAEHTSHAHAEDNLLETHAEGSEHMPAADHGEQAHDIADAHWEHLPGGEIHMDEELTSAIEQMTEQSPVHIAESTDAAFMQAETTPGKDQHKLEKVLKATMLVGATYYVPVAYEENKFPSTPKHRSSLRTGAPIDPSDAPFSPRNRIADLFPLDGDNPFDEDAKAAQALAEALIPQIPETPAAESSDPATKVTVATPSANGHAEKALPMEQETKSTRGGALLPRVLEDIRSVAGALSHWLGWRKK